MADLGVRLVAEVEALGNPRDAREKAVFFRTGPGGYGEGDEFAGVRVPPLRQIARRVRREVTVADAEVLLAHRLNEVRLLGALLLVEIHRRGESSEAVDAVLKNLDRLNNWNIVDSIAPYVLGAWLVDHPRRRGLLDEMVASESLWHRRIAIVSCLGLIRAGSYDEALRLSRAVLGDRHDLIHKASGWMLRETGRRDRAALDGFLDAHAHEMPRTMLRYAIEKHSPDERRHYLGQLSRS